MNLTESWARIVTHVRSKQMNADEHEQAMKDLTFIKANLEEGSRLFSEKEAKDKAIEKVAKTVKDKVDKK